MENVFLTCAVVGGTLMLCQFVLGLFALGGGHDAGGGHDTGGHDAGGDHDASGHDPHHEGQDHGSHSFFAWFTFRTITAGLAFFGLVGLAALRFEVEEGPALVMALAAGGTVFFLVGWMMRQMGRLNVDGTARIERAVGKPGIVYLTIPGSQLGAGKIHVSVQQRTLEVKAVTTGDPLPTGTRVQVVALVGRDTVQVARTS